MMEYFKLLKDWGSSVTDEIPGAYFCLETQGDSVPDALKPLWLRQFWSKSLPSEKAFAVFWREKGHLNILGVYEDSDVFSNAAGRNDHTFLKGDVLEFFFQPAGGKHYFEIHLTPNLATLELSIPDSKKLNSFKMEELATLDSKLECWASQFSCEGVSGWWGRMRIPFEALRIKNVRGLAGKFTVCRYNYNRKWGKKPEHSSTSPLPKIAFHVPECWQELHFS